MLSRWGSVSLRSHQLVLYDARSCGRSVRLFMQNVHGTNDLIGKYERCSGAGNPCELLGPRLFAVDSVR